MFYKVIAEFNRFFGLLAKCNVVANYQYFSFTRAKIIMKSFT